MSISHEEGDVSYTSFATHHRTNNAIVLSLIAHVEGKLSTLPESALPKITERIVLDFNLNIACKSEIETWTRAIMMLSFQGGGLFFTTFSSLITQLKTYSDPTLYPAGTGHLLDLGEPLYSVNAVICRVNQIVQAAPLDINLPQDMPEAQLLMKVLSYHPRIKKRLHEVKSLLISLQKAKATYRSIKIIFPNSEEFLSLIPAFINMKDHGRNTARSAIANALNKLIKLYYARYGTWISSHLLEFAPPTEFLYKSGEMVNVNQTIERTDAYIDVLLRIMGNLSLRKLENSDTSVSIESIETFKVHQLIQSCLFSYLHKIESEYNEQIVAELEQPGFLIDELFKQWLEDQAASLVKLLSDHRGTCTPEQIQAAVDMLHDEKKMREKYLSLKTEFQIHPVLLKLDYAFSRVGEYYLNQFHYFRNLAIKASTCAQYLSHGSDYDANSGDDSSELSSPNSDVYGPISPVRASTVFSGGLLSDSDSDDNSIVTHDTKAPCNKVMIPVHTIVINSLADECLKHCIDSSYTLIIPQLLLGILKLDTEKHFPIFKKKLFAQASVNPGSQRKARIYGYLMFLELAQEPNRDNSLSELLETCLNEAGCMFEAYNAYCNPLSKAQTPYFSEHSLRLASRFCENIFVLITRGGDHISNNVTRLMSRHFGLLTNYDSKSLLSVLRNCSFSTLKAAYEQLTQEDVTEKDIRFTKLLEALGKYVFNSDAQSTGLPASPFNLLHLPGFTSYFMLPSFEINKIPANRIIDWSEFSSAADKYSPKPQTNADSDLEMLHAEIDSLKGLSGSDTESIESDTEGAQLGLLADDSDEEMPEVTLVLPISSCENPTFIEEAPSILTASYTPVASAMKDDGSGATPPTRVPETQPNTPFSAFDGTVTPRGTENSMGEVVTPVPDAPHRRAVAADSSSMRSLPRYDYGNLPPPSVISVENNVVRKILGNLVDHLIAQNAMLTSLAISLADNPSDIVKLLEGQQTELNFIREDRKAIEQLDTSNHVHSDIHEAMKITYLSEVDPLQLPADPGFDSGDDITPRAVYNIPNRFVVDEKTVPSTEVIPEEGLNNEHEKPLSPPPFRENSLSGRSHNPAVEDVASVWGTSLLPAYNQGNEESSTLNDSNQVYLEPHDNQIGIVQKAECPSFKPDIPSMPSNDTPQGDVDLSAEGTHGKSDQLRIPKKDELHIDMLAHAVNTARNDIDMPKNTNVTSNQPTAVTQNIPSSGLLDFEELLTNKLEDNLNSNPLFNVDLREKCCVNDSSNKRRTSEHSSIEKARRLSTDCNPLPLPEPTTGLPAQTAKPKSKKNKPKATKAGEKPELPLSDKATKPGLVPGPVIGCSNDILNTDMDDVAPITLSRESLGAGFRTNPHQASSTDSPFSGKSPTKLNTTRKSNSVMSKPKRTSLQEQVPHDSHGGKVDGKKTRDHLSDNLINGTSAPTSPKKQVAAKVQSNKKQRTIQSTPIEAPTAGWGSRIKKSPPYVPDARSLMLKQMEREARLVSTQPHGLSNPTKRVKRGS